MVELLLVGQALSDSSHTKSWQHSPQQQSSTYSQLILSLNAIQESDVSGSVAEQMVDAGISGDLIRGTTVGGDLVVGRGVGGDLVGGRGAG